MTIRPPGRVTRTTSLATSNGLGANIAPKMLMTRSKLSSLISWRSDASPSWNLQLERPRLCARALPASTRLLAMSTPRTFAPSLAAGSAVVPSPQPRSKTSRPLAIPKSLTSASPLSLMLTAMRVKSPFSQSSLFGFIGPLSLVDAREGGAFDSHGHPPRDRKDCCSPHLLRLPGDHHKDTSSRAECLLGSTENSPTPVSTSMND